MAARNREFTLWPGIAQESPSSAVLLPQKKETVSCRYLDPDNAARVLLDILKEAEDL
jgi:hypothetical protein